MTKVRLWNWETKKPISREFTGDVYEIHMPQIGSTIVEGQTHWKVIDVHHRVQEKDTIVYVVKKDRS